MRKSCYWASWPHTYMLSLVQDAPEGSNIEVTSAKGDNKAICNRCYYLGRGSLNKIKQAELIKLVRKSPALRKKYLG